MPYKTADSVGRPEPLTAFLSTSAQTCTTAAMHSNPMTDAASR